MRRTALSYNILTLFAHSVRRVPDNWLLVVMCPDIVSSSCAARVSASSPSPTTWWYTNARTPTNDRSPATSVASAFDARIICEITGQSHRGGGLLFSVVYRMHDATLLYVAPYCAVARCPSLCPSQVGVNVKSAKWIMLVSTSYLYLISARCNIYISRCASHC